MYTHLETGSQHLFCPECGIHVLHLHAHHPECLAVNAFCLNPLPSTLSVGQVPASVLMGPSMPVVDATESIPIAKQVDNSETTKSLDDILLAYIQSPPSPRRKDSRDSIATTSTTMSDSQPSIPSSSPRTREVDVLTMKYQLERYIKVGPSPLPHTPLENDRSQLCVCFHAHHEYIAIYAQCLLQIVAFPFSPTVKTLLMD